MLSAIVPSSTTPDYVSLADYEHASLLVAVQNGTGVTGSAITLKQAQDVGGTSEKTLSFANVWRSLDCDAADGLTKAAVTSDTFTTDATSSKRLLYQVEVDRAELDVNNGFTALRVGTGNATRATVTVLSLLTGRVR